MSSDWSLNVIRRSDGVLHPVLVHRGVPLILPNLWIDDLSLTCRFNTLKAYLYDVLNFYRWAADCGVVVHECFARLQGPSPSSLKSAAIFMCTLRNGGRASQSSCARMAQSLRSFCSFSFDYFLAKKSLGLLEQRQCERNRSACLAKIDKLFVMRSRQGESTLHTDELLEGQLCSLEAVLNPASESNPFSDFSLKVRNYCIWRTMLATGARRGEVALLELDDLSLGAKPTITIRRPSQASMNRRRDGASLKTAQRTLPITTDLANLLETYIEDWRFKQIQLHRPSAALFLSAGDGRRLSTSTVNKILKQAAMAAGLSRRVHPHCLRTTAMNELSRKARDKAGRLAPSFRDHLTYFAGWSPSSDMPLTYTREALSEALGILIRTPGEPK